MKKVVNVGVIGCGIVGTGTIETLINNRETIRAKTGMDINLMAVADLSIDKKRSSGWFNHIQHAYANADDLINNPDIDIVVELVGGYTFAKTFILNAIKNKKHVVTANKALLALHGREIFAAAQENGVEIGFEASVGGAIPIIKVIKEDLAANNVLEIAAIINGTCNYILTRMTKEGASYEAILKDAQALGYAEADPTFDVEGIDTAHKITLLSSIAFGSWVEFDKVHTEGITHISPVDIDFAKELGCTIKLLAVSKKWDDGGVEVHVHPTMVPDSAMLASVSDSFNAIRLTSDMAGVTLHYGRGAGGTPTSSAVVGDIINTARNMNSGCTDRVPVLGFVDTPVAVIKDMADSKSAFYLHFAAVDNPGVLSTIAGVLAKNNISIKSALQRPISEDKKNTVPLVFLTHQTTGRQLNNAVQEIDGMDIVSGKSVVIRVMDVE